jgi:uncharacterized membrane protein
VRYSRDESEFDRAIGFLDATFALALTLLVTTIDVSDPASAWKSLSTLDGDVGPQLIAFGITFVVIANYWLVHHRMVADFAYIDVPAIVANLFLIAAIVLLPFSTQAVGDPATDDLALPVAWMAVDVAAASALSTLSSGSRGSATCSVRNRRRRSSAAIWSAGWSPPPCS